MRLFALGVRGAADVLGAGVTGEAVPGIAWVAPLGRNVSACQHHGAEGGTATVDDGGKRMKDHNGVLMMQRVLLAVTLGLAMARKARAILEGEPGHAASPAGEEDLCPQGEEEPHGVPGVTSFREPQGAD